MLTQPCISRPVSRSDQDRNAKTTALDPVLINLFMDSSQIIEVLRTNRMHVVHEELRGVPSGEYLCHHQQPRGNAMILAGQRRQQCVEANLFLYVIGEKINSEIMGIFSKKPCLVIGSAHVSVMVIYQSPLALIYRHIWLQLDTRYL